MNRKMRFTLLCNPDERQAISQLAKHLKRSQSDAVRSVILEATKKLTQDELPVADPNQAENHDPA